MKHVERMAVGGVIWGCGGEQAASASGKSNVRRMGVVSLQSKEVITTAGILRAGSGRSRR
jgi:hypothetical protein